MTTPDGSPSSKTRLKALLVSVPTPEVTDEEAESSMAELTRLVGTLGFDVVAESYQRRVSTTGGTMVGVGKLRELARYTGGSGVVEKGPLNKKPNKAQLRARTEREEAEIEDDEAPSLEDELYDTPDEEDSPDPEVRAEIVVFDCDLTPSQIKNLQKALAVEVLDRTGVIIEIFSRHARSRIAKAQVEIARLNYMAPRLRETGGGSERQAGRGAGETEVELDRRRVRDRITELKGEIERLQLEQAGRRNARHEQATVALVGYTNAGKSSLMRALTGSQVLVEDKLFATLDTTVRALQPETHPRILASDTVGFIKKLPHDLVASFRSTLDEALNAGLLLYVVDASDPSFRSQLDVTREVIGEVGAGDTPSILVLNKRDRVSAEEATWLKREFRDAILISTRNPEDVKALRERIVNHFERGMSDEEVLVPYSAKGAIGEIRAGMRVLSESFGEEGVRYRLRAKATDLERFRKKYALGKARDEETVKAFYAALNRGDIEAALELFSPDIVRNEFAGTPNAGTFRGLAEMRENLVRGRSTWAEGPGCQPERWLTVGDKVIAFVHVNVRLKDHREWIDGRTTDGFTLRDGKITEFHSFASEDEALAWSGVKD